MFNQKITLYHRTEDSTGERWIRFVLDGVYFTLRTGERVKRTGVSPDNGGSLLIPRTGHPGYFSPREWTGLGWTIAPGDWLLEGDAAYEIIKSPSELKKLGEAHRVTEIKALLLGEMAHWKVWCDGSQS